MCVFVCVCVCVCVSKGSCVLVLRLSVRKYLCAFYINDICAHVHYVGT